MATVSSGVVGSSAPRSPTFSALFSACTASAAGAAPAPRLVIIGGTSASEVRRVRKRRSGGRFRPLVLAAAAATVMATSPPPLRVAATAVANFVAKRRVGCGSRSVSIVAPSFSSCFVGGGRIRAEAAGAAITKPVFLPPPYRSPIVTDAFHSNVNGAAGNGRRFSSSLHAGGGASEEGHHRRMRPNIVPMDYDEEVERAMTLSGYKRPGVNWYPGHIAKAERMLAETLRSVDVVIEVRDARAPKATAHPQVGEWAAGRPRIVVLTKVDTVPAPTRVQWKRSYDAFGAGNWDSDVDGQVRNQALQALSERRKHDATAGGVAGGTGGGGGDDGGGGRAVSDVEDVLFIDAKRGQGVHSIHRAVLRAGAHVNERRRKRGLSERPLRVGVIGYPNVGKSALINRILGRRRAKSANTPGVTRTLQWIRVRGDRSGTGTSGGGKGVKKTDFELLDSPGIIPANIADQSDAFLLAACNSIGTGAYDNQGVASYLFEWIKTLHLMGKGEITSPQWRDKCRERYGFDPMLPLKGQDGEEDRPMTGEDMLYAVADNTCRGDPEDAARKILQDFRGGRLGPVSLQLAPESGGGDGQQRVRVKRGVAAFSGVTEEQWLSKEATLEREREERERRSAAAMEAAKQKGLELPPIMSADDSASTSDEVGKGQFDGW